MATVEILQPSTGTAPFRGRPPTTITVSGLVIEVPLVDLPVHGSAPAPQQVGPEAMTPIGLPQSLYDRPHVLD